MGIKVKSGIIGVLCVLYPIFLDLYAQVTFTNITIPAGFDTTQSCSYEGVDWVDYNCDGYYDLYLGRYLLYKNNGNETFTLVGNNLGLPTGYISSSSFGDFDNDGYPDLILLPGWFHSSFPGKVALLYKNINGDSFTFWTD
ncbi:MAG: VCBS repeat-containing protein, partial [candidate division WOR-3 bacterium]